MNAPYSGARTLFAAMLARAGAPLLYSRDAVPAVFSQGSQIPLAELNFSPRLERPAEIRVKTTERVLRTAPPSYPVNEAGFMVSLPVGRTFISCGEVEERITRRVRGCAGM